MLYKILKWVYTLISSILIGVVANIVLFFSAAFLFAGAAGDRWIWWYFEAGNGSLFLAATLLLAVPTIPFTRKLNIVAK